MDSSKGGNNDTGMKYVKRILIGLLSIFGLLALIYVLGPKVASPNLDTSLPKLSMDLEELEEMIKKRETKNAKIKKDNESRIIWYDSIPKKTEYSIVYLHGWSASQGEGDPVHLQTAKEFGCNLFLPRLAGHGLQEKEAMLNLTADDLITSAKEAIAIGKLIGNKVILMGTSTGGTLALHLASGNPEIAALILYSPNIEIFDKSSKLLSKPWGLELAKKVKGSNYHSFVPDSELKAQYWTTEYRLEALTHLQALMDATMTSDTFNKIEQPVFLGYFYKNDSIQDQVVSVPAMLSMFDALGTQPSQKYKEAFPEVGDHVMASYITSKDVEAVQEATNAFLNAKVFKSNMD